MGLWTYTPSEGSIYDPSGERSRRSIWDVGLLEGVPPIMRLSEMYGDEDQRTFEERRAEVVAIVRAAADFAGADYGLRGIFLAMSEAHDETAFDEAFDTMAASLSENTARYLQTA